MKIKCTTKSSKNNRVARYRKAVSSTLWLQLAMVVCYLPFGVADALIPRHNLSSSLYTIREFTMTLVFLNSSLNPILYCWKMKEVRQAARETLRQFCCWLSNLTIVYIRCLFSSKLHSRCFSRPKRNFLASLLSQGYCLLKLAVTLFNLNSIWNRERLLSGNSLKTNVSKFQLDMERTEMYKQVKSVLAFSIGK